MSERVTLRPVSQDDLPLLRTLTQDPDATGEFEQYGWYAPGCFSGTGRTTASSARTAER